MQISYIPSKYQVFKPRIFYSLILLHLLSFSGVYLLVNNDKWCTILIQVFLLTQISGFGITAGAHRLWSHKSYKATPLLKIILWIFCCLANQGSIFHWVRDHRTHHKGSDTTSDPHNIKNGFIFAHMGWLWYTKHPDVLQKSSQLKFDDMKNDWVVWLDQKLYPLPHLVACYVLPTMYGKWMFGSYKIGFLVFGVLRWILLSHITWSVNSFAHMFGDKPYSKFITSSQNFIVSLFAVGEGWHNYHHTYPYDYRAGELPWYIQINITTLILDCFGKLGLAYDFKIAPSTLSKRIYVYN